MRKKQKQLAVDPTFHCENRIDVPQSKWIHNGQNMIVGNYPLQLDIELNTDCNYKCIMCIQSIKTPRAYQIPFFIVQMLLLDGAKNGLESIKLNYRGEPLLYKRFEDVIRLARMLGIYVHFNTNGSLLTRDIAQLLIDTEVNKVIFSVDSSIPRIYNTIRRGGSFSNVFHNIKTLARLKRKIESILPRIRIQAVKQEYNKKEIESRVYDKLWKNSAEEVAWEEELDLLDNSQDYTILSDWHCAQPWQRLIVLANGQVLPCCGGIDYKDDIVYAVGNLNNEKIQDIWLGLPMEALRKHHREGSTHLVQMCRKCRVRKNVLEKVKL